MLLEKKYNKVILLVLDGFGIGAMDDVVEQRPNDIGSNTALNVLKSADLFKLPNLRKLGLFDLLKIENNNFPYIVSSSDLAHFGADSYFGHQELMGTKPLLPSLYSFVDDIEIICDYLKGKKHHVEVIKDVLVVDDSFTIANNIETDFGLAFNMTADLNKISFVELKRIAYEIRKLCKVPRLIVFGSKETNISKIRNAIETSQDGRTGVNAPKSGVYTTSYECVHLGYGVDHTEQISQKLSDSGKSVCLIGKAADVITCDGAKYMPAVDTSQVFDYLQESVQNNDFIFANVQETDLAGHAQNVNKYVSLLYLIDERIGDIVELIDDTTLFIVTADHGDDPTIGHPQHTRETVPILIYDKQNTKQIVIDKQHTLSSVGKLIENSLS